MMWIDIDEMPYLWQMMWFKLAQLEGDRCCENDGEVWQYMGSKIEDDKLIHTFRHRCHPRTLQQEYRHISTAINGGV